MSIRESGISVTKSRSPGPASSGPEVRLLASLCAASLKHGTTLPRVGAVGLDWSRFAALARHHRVSPLVWRNLREWSDVEIPAWVVQDFREAYQENALHSLRLTSHLVRITAKLAASDIAAIPLKGISLAARYYPDLASRHAGDIDLLVAPAHLDRATETIRALGYLRVSNKSHVVVAEPFTEEMYFRFHCIFISPDGVLVELHFRLHNNPDILAVDVPDIVAAGNSVQFGNVSLRTMPDALQFVFLATHGARHEWVRLQWVCDIAVMVDRATPDEVRAWLAEAERYGLANPAVQALVLAHRLLGVALPPEVARAYARSRRIRYMVRRAEEALAQPAGKAEEPEATFKLGRRLYRMCMTSRPRYLWHELQNGFKAISARLMKPAPPAA
jgi:hypothetical protein